MADSDGLKDLYEFEDFDTTDKFKSIKLLLTAKTDSDTIIKPLVYKTTVFYIVYLAIVDKCIFSCGCNIID